MSRRLIDTGIKWIGTLPDTWSLTTVNKIFFRRKEVNDVENPTVLSLARDGVKVRDISTNEGQLAESYDNYHKVYKNDLMINPMDLISGANCSLSEVEGVISPAYINLAKKDNIYPKYYDYFFKYQYWINAMFIHGKGVSFDNRWTINWETMANYKLPYPKFEEQKRIADYLDKQSLKIDEIIKDNSRQIELLQEYKKSIIRNYVTKGIKKKEFKSSNIDWIGLIPNNWKISKVKYEFKNLDNLRLPISAELRNKTNPQYDYYGASGVIDKIDEYNVEGKNLLIGEDGANLLLRNLPLIYKASGKYWVNNHAHIINPLNSNDYDFCAYMLEAGDYYTYITGSAQPKLSQTNLNNFKIPIPPIKEQKEISTFLDKQCVKLDKVIEYRKQIIEKLEEYKKSLIYECVTGKREV